jgi:hypothetical protein
MKVPWAALIFAAAVIPVAASAEVGTFGTRIATAGDWAIFRQTDSMTDAPTCLATYRGRDDIQLDHGSLAFGLAGKGGVSSYWIRWDDAPASGPVLASNIEQKIGAVILKNDSFAQVRSSQRVRIRVLTIFGSLVDFEVNLSSAPEALTILSGPNCVRQ